MEESLDGQEYRKGFMKEKIKDKMERISSQILSISRNELYVSMRFLDIALNSLSYQLYLSTTTVGTDGEKILYNPNYLVRLYRDDMVLINRGYLHMLFHCLFCHMMYKDAKDEEVWNIACDIAVESLVDELNYRCVKLTVSDYRNEVYEYLKEHLHVLTAEGIYHVLNEKKLSFKERKELEKEFKFCDHTIWERLKENERDDASSEDRDTSNNKADRNDNSGSGKKDGKKEEKEQNNSTDEDNLDKSSIKSEEKTDKNQNHSRDVEKQLKENWEYISEKVQSNLETIFLEEDAKGLAKALHVERREHYDYKEFLRKFAVRSEEIQVDMDSFDYVYYHYGLTYYDNMPFIEPLEYKDETLIREFVIVIDTSASCSGPLIKKFIEESYKILTDRQSFAKKVNIYMIQCDDRVQDVKKITNEDELQEYIDHFESKGYGETDFRPAFTYINKLVEEKEFHDLKGVLYFTDGEGIYPVKRPKYDTAFVFVDDRYSHIQVPSWAIKLLVKTEDII